MARFRITRRFDAYISYSTVVEAEDEDAALEIAEENDDLKWSEPDYQQFDDFDDFADQED